MVRLLFMSLYLPYAPRGGAGVVKEILLRVAAEFTEIIAAEFAHPRGGYLALPFEVILAQDALDPDIDGEGAHPLVGEEEHAIGDFFAHAREPAQFRRAPRHRAGSGSPRGPPRRRRSCGRSSGDLRAR